ncbi:MAG: YdiU family protein [Bdellovibrionaceae bacterium]|nr:YdiU family protein [Pseudobdellovibrionaceae bacterium]
MKLQNTYLNLPSIFYQKVNPSPVAEPKLVVFNEALAKELGLDVVQMKSAPEVFSGNKIVPGSIPIAQAYAGHQFGHLNILGDGRAHLLGEIIDAQGQRWDMQLKGSGLTPFSRGGDGRAALGPMLREYIISEAMHALGIPTTRSLAVVTTGETVDRDTRLPGAILTRIAASHIRVGTFEFAAVKGGVEAVKALADYSISRHYPELINSSKMYLAFLNSVIRSQALLIAKWMNVGFIHGVMNTDNMTISGETIDYGPCAFLDEYDLSKVFSSIDQRGRYAFGNQPLIAQWNLARLAETLIPLLDDDQKVSIKLAEEAIVSFFGLFQKFHLQGQCAKLGFEKIYPEDAKLIQQLFQCMTQAKADYTMIFRALTEEKLHQHVEFQQWMKSWEQRVQAEGLSIADAVKIMKKNNPVVIPRNHFVEEALKEASVNYNYAPIEALAKILKEPFKETSENTKFRESQPGHSLHFQTFCGT